MTSQNKLILQIISFLGLTFTIIPAFLVFGEILSKEICLWLMVLGMLMWFSTAIFWIKRDHLG